MCVLRDAVGQGKAPAQSRWMTALNARRGCNCPDWLHPGPLRLPGRWIPALPEALGEVTSARSVLGSPLAPRVLLSLAEGLLLARPPLLRPPLIPISCPPAAFTPSSPKWLQPPHLPRLLDFYLFIYLLIFKSGSF